MNALSDFEFQGTQFVPYLEPTFSLVFSLLKEAKECDTKVNVHFLITTIFGIDQLNVFANWIF